MEVLALLMAVKVDGINIPEAKFTVGKYLLHEIKKWKHYFCEKWVDVLERIYPVSAFISDKPDRNLVDQQVFTKHGNALVNAARDLLFCVGRDVQGN